MTVSSLNIKINVHETNHNEEWVAQKKNSFWGDKVTIKFYQREKNPGNFQKIADFFTGVKPGREVAAKYINELGLAKAGLNIQKNHAKPTDAELNEVFQSAAKKSNTSTAFEGNDPLVSHRDNNKQKEITIKINGKEIQNATRHRQQLQNEETNFFLHAISMQGFNLSQIKLPIISIELAVDIRENDTKEMTLDQVGSASKELLKFKEESKGQAWFNQALENRVDSLINVLEIKLGSLNQAAQVEKSAQNAAAKLIRRNESDAFFNGLLVNLKIHNTVRDSVYLAALTAIKIRENPSEQESNKKIQDTYNKLTNFRDTHKTLEGFDVVSDMLDNLINVLEIKLISA